MSGVYMAACTSAGCRVLSTVTEAYDSGAPELICAGNSTAEVCAAPLIAHAITRALVLLTV